MGINPCGFFVGVAGLEPATSSTRTKRATRLRHTPNDADYTPGLFKLQAMNRRGLRYQPSIGLLPALVSRVCRPRSMYT